MNVPVYNFAGFGDYRRAIGRGHQVARNLTNGLAMTLAVLAVSGCAPAAPPKLWVRTDGAQIAANPALQTQLEIDKTVCIGDAQKTNLSAGSNPYSGVITAAVENERRASAARDVAVACMATRGYVLSDAATAAETSARMAETHAARVKAGANNAR